MIILKRTKRIFILAGCSLLLLGCTEAVSPKKIEHSTKKPVVSQPSEQNNSSSKAKLESKTAKVKVKAKTVQKPGEVLNKSFDDIKFEMDKEKPFKRSMLTDEIEAIVGNRIRIRGFIFPTAQSKGIKSFVLVRDDQECCFGQGAALFDCILVNMTPGNTAKFSMRPVEVEGRFEVKEVKGPNGKHMAIYRMEADSVK